MPINYISTYFSIRQHKACSGLSGAATIGLPFKLFGFKTFMLFSLSFCNIASWIDLHLCVLIVQYNSKVFHALFKAYSFSFLVKFEEYLSTNLRKFWKTFWFVLLETGYKSGYLNCCWVQYDRYKILYPSLSTPLLYYFL